MKSAQQILFEHIIYNTKLSNLDAVCIHLYDAKALDAKNSDTGATLLGLAIAFSRSKVVNTLLKYGADINLATGLKGKEDYLPIALAVALKIATPTIKASELLLPGKHLPAGEPAEHKPSSSDRLIICEQLIQAPSLNLQHPDRFGRTALAQVKELKCAEKDKALYQRLTLRDTFGVAEPLSDFEEDGGTLNFRCTNKLKPYVRSRDEGPKVETGIWLLKTLEKKDTFVPFSQQELLIDTTEYTTLDSSHQKAWKTIADDQSKLKCLLYKTGKQWWACGRSEKSEIFIVPWPWDLNPKKRSKSDDANVIESMQGLLRFTRCRREVVAMQWHQLFNHRQPRYQLAVGKTPLDTAVAVKNIPFARNLSTFFQEKKPLPEYLENIADVLCDLFISGDVDANIDNFMIIIHSSIFSIVHIDGDKCWPKLREFTDGDRFAVGDVFAELLQQKTAGEYKYYSWNFFDRVVSGKKCDDAPIFNWIAGMIKTPRFKKEFHAAVLKRICLPDSFVKHFINHYVSDSYESTTLATTLSKRLTEVKEVAMKDIDFKKYVETEDAAKEMANFMQRLVTFKTDDRVFLCSLYNQPYNDVWKTVTALVPKAKDLAAIKPALETPDIKISSPKITPTPPTVIASPVSPALPLPKLAPLPELAPLSTPHIGPKKVTIAPPKPLPLPIPATTPKQTISALQVKSAEIKIEIAPAPAIINSPLKVDLTPKPINLVAELCHKLVVGSAQDAEIIADIKSLQAQQIDVNAYDPASGATPLGLAITFILPDIVQALLDAGANPNMATGLHGKEKRSPLIVAVGKGEPSVVKNLYASDPPMSSRGPIKGVDYKPLRLKMILSLLHHPHPRVDLTYRDDQKKTIFDWAKTWNCAEKDKAVYAELTHTQVFPSVDVSRVSMVELRQKFASDEIKEEKDPTRLFARLLVAIHQHKWVQAVHYFTNYLEQTSPLVNKDDLTSEFKNKCAALLLTDKFHQTVIDHVGDVDAQLFFALAKQLPLPKSHPVEVSLFNLAVAAEQTQVILQLGARHQLPILESKHESKDNATCHLLKLVASIAKDKTGYSSQVRHDFENYLFRLSPTDNLKVFRDNWQSILKDTTFQLFINTQVHYTKGVQFFDNMTNIMSRTEVGIPSRLFKSSEFKRSAVNSVKPIIQMSLFINHCLFGTALNLSYAPRDEAKLITEYYFQEKPLLKDIIAQADALLTEFKGLESELYKENSYHMWLQRNLIDLAKTHTMLQDISKSVLTAEQLKFLQDKFLPTGIQFLGAYGNRNVTLYGAFSNSNVLSEKHQRQSLQNITDRMPELIQLLDQYLSYGETSTQIDKLLKWDFHIYASPLFAGALYAEVTRRFKTSELENRFNTKGFPAKMQRAMEIVLNPDSKPDFKPFAELTFDGKNLTNDNNGYKVKLSTESLHATLQVLENASLLAIVHNFSAAYKTADGKLKNPTSKWFGSGDTAALWLRHADDLYQLILNTAWFDKTQVATLTAKITELKDSTLYKGKFKEMIDALDIEIAKMDQNYKETSIVQYTI